MTQILRKILTKGDSAVVKNVPLVSESLAGPAAPIIEPPVVVTSDVISGSALTTHDTSNVCAI